MKNTKARIIVRLITLFIGGAVCSAVSSRLFRMMQNEVDYATGEKSSMADLLNVHLRRTEKKGA